MRHARLQTWVRSIGRAPLTRALAVSFAVALVVAAGVHMKVRPRGPVLDRAGFAKVNGIKMYYAVYGHGSPILLLHGGLSSSKAFSGEIATLARGHTVILADSRGQGQSTRTRKPITYDLMASDTLALLDTLGFRKVALVGWSDGGIIGLDIAIHHPERLTALFAQAANATPEGVIANRRAAKEGKPVPELRHYHKVSHEIEALWANEPNFTDAELGSIHVPTAIVIGANDRVISHRHTRHLAETIPDARLIVMPDAGHSAPVENPEIYAATILDFLDSLSGAPGNRVASARS